MKSVYLQWFKHFMFNSGMNQKSIIVDMFHGQTISEL